VTAASSRRTLAVAVSLNELAWLALFAAVIWFVQEIGNYKQMLATMRRDRDALQEQVATGQGFESQGQSARAVNQELVGVKGNLQSVVFVIDRSGSMNRGGRWNATRGVIKTWLEHLPIKRAAIVAFNDDVAAFPNDHTFWDMTGPLAQQNRAQLLAMFDHLSPRGNTNTLAALRMAYAYPGVDGIFLFSDGEPDSGGNRFDHQMAKQVHALCREHGSSVPVNTVGLGNYLGDRNLGWFLETIARETGGTFLGR
jgi:Mg-chelatase subunit ChlD